MSNVTYVGKQIRRFQSSPEFDGFSRIVLTVSDDVEYVAGTEMGRTLQLVCPWGTQKMADDILADIQGFQYQPYTAEGAMIDPAAELGDGITANNVYGGIYSQSVKFGSRLTATVSAPSDEEIDHEFPYVPKQERKVTRSLRQLTAELKVQAGLISAEVTDRKTETEKLFAQLSVQSGQIAAKVEKTGGNPSSFGWALGDSSWTIKANSTDILKATKSGLEVYGKVTATSGRIGGFDITADSMSYNNQSWGGTNSTGIYFGPYGIQLGKNFKVDAAGNLTAASGTFTGSVRAGSIQYGGDNGYLPGGGIGSHSITGGQIGYNTISTAYTSGGINTSLGYADFSNGVFGGWNTAPYLYVNSLHVNSYLYFGAYRITTKTLSFTDGDGKKQSIAYLAWQRA